MVSSIERLQEVMADQFDDDYQSQQGQQGQGQGQHSNKSRRYQEYKQRQQQQKSQNKQQQEKANKHNDQNNGWSINKVAEYLNINRNEAEQLEGQFMFNVGRTKRYFNFNNQTLERLPQLIKYVSGELRHGHNFNYTKIYNKNAVTIGFPLETGYPFIYTMKTPTLVKFGGDIRLRTQPDLSQGNGEQVQMPQYVNGTGSVSMVYSTMIDTKIGFLTLRDHNRYIAGYNKKFQVYLPLSYEFDYNFVTNEYRSKLTPITSRNDQNNNAQVDNEINIVQVSNWPYTARKNILDMRPVSESDDVKLIHVRQTRQSEQYFGDKSTGMSFHLQTKSERKYQDQAEFIQHLRRHDVISAMLYPWQSQTNEYYNINLSYDAHRSSSRSMELTANYKNDEQEDDYSKSQQHPRQTNSDSGNVAYPESQSPNSNKRQRQFLQNSAAGIKTSDSGVIDLSIEFNGHKNPKYIATISRSKSPVDQKARTLVYVYGQNTESQSYELCMTVNSKYPNVPELNFEKTLNYDLTSYVNVDLAYGEKCQSGNKLTMKAKFQRSQERKDYLRRQPLAQLCLKQMQDGYNQQPACQNVTERAAIMDQYQFNFEFDRVSSQLQNATYKLYSWVRQMAYPYVSENLVSYNGKHGKLDIEGRFAPDFETANITIQSPELRSEFKQLRVNSWARSLALHPNRNQWNRFMTKATRDQYNRKY